MAGAGAGSNVNEGAYLWRQGADTCVLSRAVGCSDDDSIKRENLNGYISRIVPKTSGDAETERKLSSWYPDLLNQGILAVSKYQCTPSFLDQNLANPKGYTEGPCKRFTKANAPKLANLITKEYTMSLKDYRIQDLSFLEKIDLVRGAINAVVGMVLDENIHWVIHADIHRGNILYDENTKQTALADFGRVIVVEDIRDPMSIYAGLNKYLDALKIIYNKQDLTFWDLYKEEEKYETYKGDIFYNFAFFMSWFDPTIESLPQYNNTLKEQLPRYKEIAYPLVVETLRLFGILQIFYQLGLEKKLHFVENQRGIIDKTKKLRYILRAPSVDRKNSLEVYPADIHTTDKLIYELQQFRERLEDGSYSQNYIYIKPQEGGKRKAKKTRRSKRKGTHRRKMIRKFYVDLVGK